MNPKPSRLDSNKVFAFAKKMGTFTTQEVARRFRVRAQQAAAAIAILRIKEVLEPDEPAKTPDGISRWVFVGK